MRWNRLAELRPRPEAAYIGQGHTVLAARADGILDGGPERGLFVQQTRVLSTWRYRIDGRPPRPVAVSAVDASSWLGYYVHSTRQGQSSSPEAAAAKDVVELRVSRFVNGGLCETVELTNYARQPVELSFDIELDADFADLHETPPGRQREQTGQLERRWSERDDGAFELAFDYRASHDWDHQGQQGHAKINRAMTIRLEADSAPDHTEGRIRFQVTLAPHERWTARFAFTPCIDGHSFEPPRLPDGRPDFDRYTDDAWGRWRRGYDDDSLRVETVGPETLPYVVQRTLERSRADLRALRMEAPQDDGRGWTPIAGVPEYADLFGRDALTTAWQAAMFDTEMLDGTLRRLGELQGRQDDPWRDEQPGRFIHEASRGPLQALGYRPMSRYYGTLTTPTFFPVALAQLWHWTGDRERVRPHLEPMLRAMRWLEEDAPRVEGFYAYATRSEQGVKNQAWKDSHDAIVDADGRLVDNPIATCEEQGFAYLGMVAASALCWWFDRKDEARRLFEAARDLKQRFNDRFWLDEQGFFAMGLGPGGRPIGSVGSNPGHCVATGIVDERYVAPSVGRLIADDLFSGWGVRTLSSDHPAYNPYSYHRGSVWPVENGTFALGFMRYGLHPHVHKLCRALFEAAGVFEAYRLPEVFSGHDRDGEHPFPAFYPKANSPQAWSASATASMVQALVGLYPYAPLDALLIDPHLPEWLPRIELKGLQVGQARCDLRVWRDDDGQSRWEAADQTGTLHVIHQPSPWSLTASFAERLVDAIDTLLPH